MSKIFANIFRIIGGTTLSSIEDIFSRTHKEYLSFSKKHKEEFDRLSESEKSFIYSWKSQDEVDEIILPLTSEEIQKNTLNNESEILKNRKIKFKRLVASIEYGKKNKLDESKVKFLPKSDRLNVVDIEVIFFEIDSKIFVLILSSNFNNVIRVKKLIGDKNIESNATEYFLDSDVFSWLIYIYEEKSGKLSDKLKLKNVTGFVGNVTDDANIFSGSSLQTTELIVTKAFISNGGQLKKIGIRISNEDVSITCGIDSESGVIMDCDESIKNRLFDTLDESLFCILYLYGYLILKIKSLYKLDLENFNGNERENFSKKIGLDVIHSIIKHNNIKTDDIIW